MTETIRIPTKHIHDKLTPQKLPKKPLQNEKKFKTDFSFTRIKKQQITQALRQLATLIQMRFPLDKSLDIVCEQTDNEKLKNIFQDCKQRIEKGETLANALEHYEKYFPQSVIKFAMIGEVSGRLGETMDQAAAQLEMILKLRRKLFSALSYPAIVVLVAIGAIAFLLTVEVPTFSDVFSDFGSQLPLATRLLVSMGDFLVGYWYIIIAVCLALGYLVYRLWHIPKAQLVMEKWIWRLPIVGLVIKKEKLTRFIKTLGMLVRNGILLPEAITISGKTSTSANIEKSTIGIKSQIEKGGQFYHALADVRIYPSLLIQMVRVGEEAGVLSDMLARSAEYYESEIDAAVETLNAVLEPILMIGLGIVMGAIVIAMYWQIFNVVDVIQ